MSDKVKRDSYVLFDNAPGPESPRLIEVERDGRGLNCGGWEQQPDGLWRMYLNRLPEIVERAAEIERLTAEVDDLLWLFNHEHIRENPDVGLPNWLTVARALREAADAAGDNSP